MIASMHEMDRSINDDWYEKEVLYVDEKSMIQSIDIEHDIENGQQRANTR